MLIARGFTLPELLLVLSLTIVVAVSVTLYANPLYQQKRARDNRRIMDIILLEGVIDRYMADNNSIPPDISDPIRTSLEAASGVNPSQASGLGWISTDLTRYVEKLPLDPLNTSSFLYRYRRAGMQYELDARLEVLNDISSNVKDGGNNNDRYEVGTNLTLLN